MRVLCGVLGISLVLGGCATLKQAPVTHSPTASLQEYQEMAQSAKDDARYRGAKQHLDDLRTFYPATSGARDALLDLIYVSYQVHDFEAVLGYTDEFLRLYPNDPDGAYALYVQGVTHMQGSPKAGRFIKLDAGKRDNAYLRLAYADFEALNQNYPNHPYRADVDARLLHLYNQFAIRELEAARHYIAQGAYVAALERARWVFQYYPQSVATPDALAILAHGNQMLGQEVSAQAYREILRLNHPEYLLDDGQVNLHKAQDASTLSRVFDLPLLRRIL